MIHTMVCFFNKEVTAYKKYAISFCVDNGLHNL